MLAISKEINAGRKFKLDFTDIHAYVSTSEFWNSRYRPMKCNYSIDVAHSLVHKRHVGDITVEEEIQLVDAVLSDPTYRKGMNSLCDFTEATVNWSLGDLDRYRSYVTRIKTVTGKCKWAIVFPSGKDNSTARMFIALHEAFQDTISVKLFSNSNEALAWLQSATDQPTL